MTSRRVNSAGIRRPSAYRLVGCAAAGLICSLACFASNANAEFAKGIADEGFRSADPATRSQFMDRAERGETGVIRISMSWADAAPEEPANPADPADPAYRGFDAYDAAVSEA